MGLDEIRSILQESVCKIRANGLVRVPKCGSLGDGILKYNTGEGFACVRAGVFGGGVEKRAPHYFFPTRNNSNKVC